MAAEGSAETEGKQGQAFIPELHAGESVSQPALTVEVVEAQLLILRSYTKDKALKENPLCRG